MADNVPFLADSTQIIAADDITGNKHQRVKVSLGEDGTALDATGNLEKNALASAARTATTSSADQTNNNARGIQVILSVSAGTTLSLITTIEGKGLGGNYYAVNANPTAVTGTGVYVYEIYPGVGAASGAVTQRTSGVVPRTFRVTVTHGNANSATYQVNYCLIV